MSKNKNNKQGKPENTQDQKDLDLVRQQQKAGQAQPRGFGRAGMGFAQKAKDFKGTFRRLTTYMGREAYLLAFVIFITIVGTGVWIVGPRISGEATTNIFLMAEGLSTLQNVVRLLVIAGILYTSSSIISYIASFLISGVAQRIVFRMRREMKQKLDRVPLKFYDKNSYGETLSRMTNDIDTISTTLQQTLLQVISAVIQVVGSVIMMFTIHWLLALIVVGSIPISLLATAFIAKRSQKQFKRSAMHTGQINAHIEEMYGSHTVVKAFSYEQKAIEQFDNINADLYDASKRAQFLTALIMPLMRFLSNVTYVLVVVVGAIHLRAGRISAGDIQASVQYVRTLGMPISQAAQIIGVIQSTIASAERVFEILDEEEIADVVSDQRSATSEQYKSDQREATSGQIETETAINKETQKPHRSSLFAEPSSIKGDIEFNNVTFGYEPEKIIINNMNLTAKAGQTIAIVGPTGAGKTTIVNLLMRFYEINSGKITLDGTDISTLDHYTLRKCFGMVLQDTWLFNGSIRDNIAYGKEDATDEEIIKAATKAQAHYFIEKMPDGYNTILNEDATNISAGQKQLLTIARVFLANPAIIILDEATSSVDTRTEVSIKQALQSLSRGRTSFVIAHRLSTIRSADIILVVNNGDIVEQGNHNQLLAKGGYYARLHQSQFSEEAS
ncbi:MAG: ABC transporter ATP-binding protein/permease [Firmicutes bacterium]|nr:ABC transporter ATP-binding protein/permease [Bacillota bacterium]